MAVVPRVRQQVAGSLAPAAFQTARADALSQGGGIAVGLSAVGQGAMDLARGLHVVDQAQKKEAEGAELLQANNAADKLSRDLLLDPNNGYLATAGRGAVENRDQVLKDYERGLASIRKGLSSTELQNEWDRQYNGRKNALTVDVYEHALKQAQAWRVGEAEGRVANATAYAAATWQDPQRLQINIADVRGAAERFAQAQGMGQEAGEAYVRSKVSVAHYAAVQQMIASGEVLRAGRYVQANRDSFSPKHLIAADQSIREAAQVAGGQALGDAAISYGKQKVDPIGDLLVQPQASDALFSALVSQESAGNAAAVSPKGAVGLAQVMPSTARWIAGQLGESDVAGMNDEELTRWLQVPENSSRYGRFYLDAMLKRFDGDTVLALAAYNAGPETVEAWVDKYGDPRMGEVTAFEFAEAIPYAETRGYVAGVLTRASRSVQGAGGGDWYAAAVEQASTIEDPEIRAVAMRRIEDVRSTEETVAKRNRAQLEAEAEALIEDGTNPDDLPAATRQALGAVKMGQYRGIWEKRADRQTDFELYDQLSRMPAEQMADFDLFSVQHRLAPAQYNEMKQRQAEAQKIVGGQSVKYEPFSLTQRRSALFQRLGIDGAKGSEQRGRLSAWIDQAMRDAAGRKGGPLTPQEEDQVLQRSLSVVTSGGWFSGDVHLGEVDELSDLTSEERDALRQAFPNMSDDQLLETFMRLKLSGQIP